MYAILKFLNMKKTIYTIILTISFFYLNSCSQRLTDFTVISTKNTNMIIPPEIQGTRVEGSDAAFILLGIPISTPSVKEAIDKAIEKAGPGYDALIDGVVTIKFFSIGIFGQTTYVVEGNPIKSSGIKTAHLNGVLDQDKYKNMLFHSRTGIENKNINYKKEVD